MQRSLPNLDHECIHHSGAGDQDKIVGRARVRAGRQAGR